MLLLLISWVWRHSRCGVVDRCIGQYSSVIECSVHNHDIREGTVISLYSATSRCDSTESLKPCYRCLTVENVYFIICRTETTVTYHHYCS